MNQLTPKPSESSDPQHISEIMPEVLADLRERSSAKIALEGLVVTQKELWGRPEHHAQQALQQVQDQMSTANERLTDRNYK